MEPVSFPLQSELTGGVIDSILRTGTTQLTPYGESRIHHEALIGALCGFFAEVRGTPVTACPIT